jgi:membrane associated rhomboid family serine protease
MKPKGMMIMGAVLYAAAIVFAVFDAAPSVLMSAFIGGLFLGKGYGVWEERQQRNSE